MKTIYLLDTRDKVILFQDQLKLTFAILRLFWHAHCVKYYILSKIGCTTMEWSNRVRRHNIEDMKEMKRLCKIIAPNNSEINSP